MEIFTISRIVTSEGVFKVAGERSTPSSSATEDASTIITSLEIMSTDGWQSLDISADSVIAIIAKIMQQITKHLDSKT